jgi:5-methylcytosine-specific restriction enzyme A
MSNPNWSRDELIVALDFYFQHAPSIPSKTSPEIKHLSEVLNRLRAKVGVEGDEKFRNVNGVYMKLMNFLPFDPAYSGKGLERGGKEDGVVWSRYSTDPVELKNVANSIKEIANSDIELPTDGHVEGDEEDGEEGRILTRLHRYRERDSKLAKRKKKKVLSEQGVLRCEICEFDFSSIYGERGDGFIECHHRKPVSELKIGDKTKLTDLALVCSNCHRMIHRRRPWMSIAELSSLLKLSPVDDQPN